MQNMATHFGQTVFDLWRIVSQGGWVMGAIFLAGQVGWFLILERWWHFHKMNGKRKNGLLHRVENSITEARDSGQEAMISRAREALHQNVPGLSSHLGTLAVLAGVAPLLGLTGTVLGIMQTFRVITLYGAGNPSMMAGGIAQALMVTEAGLVVAFPLLILHDHLQKRADAIEDECVEGATKLIRKYDGEYNGKGATA
jgi:biopolymer transport protein ExbB